MAEIRTHIFVAGLLAAGLLTAVSLVIARRAVNPLEQLRHHAAAFAAHPPPRVQEEHGKAPYRDELKAAHGQMVISDSPFTAARTIRLAAPARAHLDLDNLSGFVRKTSALIHKSLEAIAAVQ